MCIKQVYLTIELAEYVYIKPVEKNKKKVKKQLSQMKQSNL